MNVLYDSQIFSNQRFGGISRYFCEIASRASNNNGICATICAPTNSNAYLEQVSSDIKFEPSFAVIKNYYIKRIFNMAAEELFNVRFSPDIIHETYYSRKPHGKSGALRILTVYDMIHERLPEFFDKSDQTAKNKLAAAHRADHIICISKSTQTDFLEISGMESERTSVIHLGFKLQEGLRESIQRASISQPMPERYILYVGQRSGYKNFANVAEAMTRSHKLVDFCLVCFGGGGFTQDEVDVFANLGLAGSRVKQVTGDDTLLSQYYKNAACFVYPSLYEGFGIPPLEAMAYNCPVACSNTSSIPEVVGDAGLYFDPTRADEIRSAIECIVSSTPLREGLVRKGRERLKCFSWDRCAAETFELYHRIYQGRT